MKQLIFLLISISCLTTGCDQDKKSDKDPKNSVADATMTRKVFTGGDCKATPEEVTRMAENYATIVLNDPGIGIQQISMDGKILMDLVTERQGIKLIAAADLTTNAITMFIQLWEKDGSYKYCDFISIFGRTSLCPPPPSCDLPLTGTVALVGMPENEVQEMAARYNELVKANGRLAIQHITMDVSLLELLLYETDRVKLIAAADVRTNKITMIMQLKRGDSYTYCNIEDVFTPDMRGMQNQGAICPPPAGCELPVSDPPPPPPFDTSHVGD